MQFRVFDGDMERWDEEEINLSPEELRRRFGVMDNNQENIVQQNEEIDNEVEKPVTVSPVINPKFAHHVGTPAFDIYDQELADRQFAEFIAAGKKSGDK